jgi:hypothetical protein
MLLLAELASSVLVAEKFALSGYEPAATAGVKAHDATPAALVVAVQFCPAKVNVTEAPLTAAGGKTETSTRFAVAVRGWLGLPLDGL